MKPSIIDRVSSPDPALVRVVDERCDEIGALLRRLEVPPDQEDASFSSLPRAEAGNFFLSLVAICHQTSPRGRPALKGMVDGQIRKGWDYLLHQWIWLTRTDPSFNRPDRWSKITDNDLASALDLDRRDRVLIGLPQRASLLNDLGERLLDQQWSTIDAAYQECKGTIVGDAPNLIDTLGRFRAYNDPVRKKSLFFLALMRNSGHWRYEDEEQLGPPVDYHEVRGHLRIGSVTIESSRLLKQISQSQEVGAQADIAIRSAVFLAIMKIAARAEISPSQAHYLFWNIFRAICTRKHPQCLETGSLSSLPDRYRNLAFAFSDTGSCPFAAVCPSAGLSMPIVEHSHETDYY